ncbi:MAG TPA: hemin uptake protein HemP [Pirellulaceae bacterium]|nr:hemin uptake protein HemP [Pirellulaceae bacterium]
MIPEADLSAATQPDAIAIQPPPVAAPKELWYSEELFGQRREILIKHGDEIYRLRCTRQGKLILNK